MFLVRLPLIAARAPALLCSIATPATTSTGGTWMGGSGCAAAGDAHTRRKTGTERTLMSGKARTCALPAHLPHVVHQFVDVAARCELIGSPGIGVERCRTWTEPFYRRDRSRNVRAEERELARAEKCRLRIRIERKRRPVVSCRVRRVAERLLGSCGEEMGVERDDRFRIRRERRLQFL